jgi:16S rRNA (adenine1518-N6/adenine1519-N6)-dimethyltransferase
VGWQAMRKPKLGQNFLVDERARHAIADALGDVRERTVVEIGPGHGAITEILAARCKRLVAIEIDRALAAELRFRFRDSPQVEIVEADVLTVDLAALTGEGADVIGNLPYYITAEILLRLFAASAAGHVKRAVVMMQREVAERVAAAPGGREYGLLSATAQMYAQVELLFTLGPLAFSPPPEVDSTVVRMEFASRFAELGVEAKAFDSFLRQCFAQKRKTLQNNLRAAGYAADELRSAWPASLPEMARAEGVDVETMAALWRGLTAEQAP